MHVSGTVHLYVEDFCAFVASFLAISALTHYALLFLQHQQQSETEMASPSWQTLLSQFSWSY